ncbi:hypothetical protein JMM81_17880 [Bacillus sp. V3B]|uniref:hypothetical protein n=1 Tax=Bacillus sp. V3B TaxID=2804915 RepID=UPI00210C50C0|nr:hypothetical protein [Bacillus sp. V3B]MCQ6276778.1 hypothetical protein [Bacillus sp. V3B]
MNDVTIFLCLLAGLAEIGRGYLVWLWIGEGNSYWYGRFGSIIFAVYRIILTFDQKDPNIKFAPPNLRPDFYRARSINYL